MANKTFRDSVDEPLQRLHDIRKILIGLTKLQLWYHHDDQFELEKMFPNDESIRWARGILDPCIVEKEKDCLQTSAELLEIIDPILIAVSRHAQVVGDSIRHRCEVCGIGIYNPIPNNDNPRNFGLNPAGSREFKIYSCSHCGHVQLFHIPNPPNVPPAWK